MQKNKLSTNMPKELEHWDQIVADAFSPDAPTHSFSAHYQKQKQELEEQMMRKKRPFIWKKKAVVAVVAAAAMVLVPTSVYAGQRIYQASVKTVGSYEQDVQIDVGDSTSDAIMALETGWLPDGLTSDDAGGAGKYGDPENENRSLTICFYQIPEGETLQASEQGIVSKETKTINGNQVIFLQRDQSDTDTGMYFDKVVWVTFTDTKYAVQMYATTELTQAELEQVAEHLSLTPAETETAGVWIPEEELTASDDSTGEETVDQNQFDWKQVGDSFQDEDEEVQGTLDSIMVQDNFDGLTTDPIGNAADYSAYQNSDGTIVDNIRTYYRAGDGVDTLDETVRQENRKQKIVVLHLTYTNTSSAAIEKCICPFLFQLSENGAITFARSGETEDGLSYSEDCDLNYGGQEFFSFTTDGDHDKNNLLLDAGETQHVTLAFMVDEADLDSFYLMETYSYRIGASVVNLQGMFQ